jgi:cohesin complex subunit SCC1
MFYSQIILAKQGPLAKVWTAAHYGDKKLTRPNIFATDIADSVDNIVHPSVPLALRVSGHLLLGVVRIYSRKVKFVLTDCTEAMLKLQLAFTNANTSAANDLQVDRTSSKSSSSRGGGGVANFGDFNAAAAAAAGGMVLQGFLLPNEDDDDAQDWILAEDDDDEDQGQGLPHHEQSPATRGSPQEPQTLLTQPQETWTEFDPEEDEDEHPQSFVSDVEVARAGNEDSFLSAQDQVRLLYA